MSPQLAANTAAPLNRLLAMQPGEGRQLGLLMLYAAAFSGGVTTIGFDGVGGVLFLSRLPASAIPYLLIIPAITITLTLLLYNRVAAHVRIGPLVLGSTALLLACALLFRVLLGTPLRTSFGLLIAIYLFTEVAMSLIGIQLWVVAGRIFDPRQARRLFPVIAATGTITTVGCGLLLGPLAQLIGVDNLLLIVAGALGVCWLCPWALSRIERAATRAGGRPAATGQGDRRGMEAGQNDRFGRVVRTMGSSPLLRAIGALTILISLLVNIGFYQFARSLQDNFAGQEVAMVGFLGGFSVWTGLAAFVVQVFVVSRIIGRFGLTPALSLFPAAAALGAGLSLLTGGSLLFMAGVRAADPIFRRTITDTALNLLYLPVPPDLRRQAKELLGGLYAVAFGLLGIVLLISQMLGAWPYLYWSIPLLLLGLVWLGLLAWTRRQYVHTLTANLRGRSIDLQSTPLDLRDPATIAVLVAALRAPEELAVLHALSLLDQAPEVDWEPYVAPLLQHPSPDVRVATLRHLGQSSKTARSALVATSLQDAGAEVCGAAISAYCALSGPDALAQVAPFLSDSRPAVQAAAVLGLIRYGGLEGIVVAAGAFSAMLHSADPLLRREGAHVMELLALPGLHGMLAPLLDDHDAGVRVRAVQAIRALQSPASMAILARKLADDATAAQAAVGLTVYGSAAVPPLAALLAAPGGDPKLRARAAASLGAGGTLQAAQTLRAYVGESDARVRAAVLAALARLHTGGVVVGIAEPVLNAALDGEIGEYYRLYMIRADLLRSGEHLLLDEALTLQQQAVLERAFDLLTIRHGTAQLGHVRAALAGRDGAPRAQAVELLDNMALGAVRDPLIAMMEAPAAQIIEIGRRRYSLARHSAEERLDELISGPDPWLRACALAYRNGQIGGRDQLLDNSANGGRMALSLIERVLALKQLPLFAEIAGEELAAVAELTQEVRFALGDVIIRQGDEGDSLYIVVIGDINVSRRGVGAVSVEHAPTVLGETALVLRQPRGADCVAATEVLALKLDQTIFNDLLKLKPEIALGIIRVLAQRLETAQLTLRIGGR